MSSNRAITLEGANKIFNEVGITITHNSELGFYESSGLIVIQCRTLTGLCQKIVRRFARGVEFEQ